MASRQPPSAYASTTDPVAVGGAVAGRGSELRVLLILSALMSFASVSTDMYLPALPTIGRALHTSTAGIELTFSAFLVGFSLGQLLWGPISDRYGRRLPIAVGLVLFIVGSVGCALSTNVTQMMVWRVVQALGACVGPVLARAMVRDLYGREQSARMLSTLILIMGVAPLLGPLLGGQILAFWSWQGIFWTLAGVGLLTLASLRLLPESLPPSRRATTPLRHTFADYLELLGDVRLMGYALAGGFFYAGAYAFIVGTPFVYIEYYHVSPQAYGWLFGLNILGMMVANFANGRLLRRFGSERLFRIGTWILAGSGIVLAVNAWFGWGGLLGLVVPIFLYMSMNGLIVANSVAGALSSFADKAGAASSLLGAMHYGSGILTAAMLGWFSDGTPWTMAWIMGLTGLGCVGTSVIATRIRTRHFATEALGR
ncbi:DHA1 family bicyclomycin/chloramphenicol resistance-like MFS transporter [Xanthomonas campestris]|uniref:Bcr/CflA family multidrug efflux MFS transporter n=1 Tax=Xanthomonas sp. CFBP 8151 TaxID=3035310 RepID=UPI00141AB945|nr:Bcr/CflA family multidrug efflux MFS transporter [Xanthomonas sp. CFBP 8151]NIJ75542.1 DHA1 family bicyclomycin/chloramphenicol resistance-like MFS transporter [Xanthomonas sp. CFBP 8151]